MAEVTPERQALQQFSPGLGITYRRDGEHVRRLLSELLPDPFGQDEKDV
ncbi:MAG: hypothetical protein ACYDGS_06115 [Thermoleophilia bacterium]